MNEEQLHTYSMLTVHQFLLEQLWALVVLGRDDPIEAAHTVRDEMLERFRNRTDGRALMSQPPEVAAALTPKVIAYLEHFWSRVDGHL